MGAVVGQATEPPTRLASPAGRNRVDLTGFRARYLWSDATSCKLRAIFHDVGFLPGNPWFEGCFVHPDAHPETQPENPF